LPLSVLHGIDTNGASIPFPLLVSTNGGNKFDLVNPPISAGRLSSISAAQDQFVAVGTEGTVIRSKDGLDWSKRLSNTTHDLSDVAYGNTQWIAVGKGGTIITSPDASAFSLRLSPTELDLAAVTTGNDSFIAVGKFGLILTSSNGSDWNTFATEEGQDLNDVAFGNGRYVAAGENGLIYTSQDATNWTMHQIRPSASLSAVAFANGIFVVAVKDSQMVYFSNDATSWTLSTVIHPITGAQSSNQTLWLVGYDAFIARAATEQLFLGSTLTSSGSVTLSFNPPEPGTYLILSCTNLADPQWETRATFSNSLSHLQWTDPNRAEPMRFYKLRRE
jgi:hypothetical protein